jgi:hypothetical protein
MGLIRFQGRKETHAGIHTPIITSTLYNKVQFVLDRKRSNFRQPHNHTFSALIHCDNCRRYLVGETKKGHTYYRCHQRRICPKTTIREDRLVTAIIGHLKHLNISPDEEPIIERALFDFKQYETEVRSKVRNDIEAELSYIETSIKTLLQKFLDGAIPKETFDDGNTALLMQRKGCEEKLRKTTTDYMLFAQTEAFINELRSICGRFASAAKTETRQIIERVFTSITMNGSDVINFSLNSFMKEIAGREKTADGWKKLLPVIYGNMA